LISLGLLEDLELDNLEKKLETFDRNEPSGNIFSSKCNGFLKKDVGEELLVANELFPENDRIIFD
jgi:hypothetical protein